MRNPQSYLDPPKSERYDGQRHLLKWRVHLLRFSVLDKLEVRVVCEEPVHIYVKSHLVSTLIEPLPQSGIFRRGGRGLKLERLILHESLNRRSDEVRRGSWCRFEKLMLMSGCRG